MGVQYLGIVFPNPSLFIDSTVVVLHDKIFQHLVLAADEINVRICVFLTFCHFIWKFMSQNLEIYYYQNLNSILFNIILK